MRPCSVTRRTFLRQAGALAIVDLLPAHRKDAIIGPPGAGRDFLARCIR